MMKDSVLTSSGVLANELETKGFGSVPEVNGCTLTGGLHNNQKFIKMRLKAGLKEHLKKSFPIVLLSSCSGFKQFRSTFELM